MGIESLVSKYNEEQLSILKSHLSSRYSSIPQRKKFNVIIDLLHQCDINCLGCGTKAVCISTQKAHVEQMRFEEIQKIVLLINDYVHQHDLIPFINFGGGEPFLRDDIINILKLTSEIIGKENVGIDTNGTLEDSYEMLKEALNYVGYIGISINGLHDYHNWWANNKNFDAYQRAIDTLSRLNKIKGATEIIEVTTVATKKNYQSIPRLMKELSNIGVKKYSVHRAMPVGRMKYWADELIMNPEEYFETLVLLSNQANKLGMNAHMHHSIEAIYATALLNINTYYMKNTLQTSTRSSVSIDPSGELLIDPWCTVGIWRNLSLGNIMDKGFSFDTSFDENGQLLQEINDAYSLEKRCRGCKMGCSGGSRLVAAATTLNKKDKNLINRKVIIDALCEVDPACYMAERI